MTGDAVRVSVIILPIYSRRRADETWSHAEELGFHAAYTYDHLSWRSFRDGPWFGMVPTLAAAAYTTRTIRLGTMVTNPNYRHPVTLAKDLMTLDELSGVGSRLESAPGEPDSMRRCLATSHGRRGARAAVR